MALGLLGLRYAKNEVFVRRGSKWVFASEHARGESCDEWRGGDQPAALELLFASAFEFEFELESVIASATASLADRPLAGEMFAMAVLLPLSMGPLPRL